MVIACSGNGSHAILDAGAAAAASVGAAAAYGNARGAPTRLPQLMQ